MLFFSHVYGHAYGDFYGIAYGYIVVMSMMRGFSRAPIFGGWGADRGQAPRAPGSVTK